MSPRRSEKSIRQGLSDDAAQVVGATAVGGVPGGIVCAAGGRSLVLAGSLPTRGGQDAERKRLHKIIERLVPWEASNNETILNEARWEIARSVAWGLGEEPPAKGDGKAILDYLQTKAPPVYDPFSRRRVDPAGSAAAGLRAYGSDLNPVAVLIGKALVEIPPKFAGQPPVNPKAQAELKRGATGTARARRASPRMFATTANGCATRRKSASAISIPKAKLPDGSRSDRHRLAVGAHGALARSGGEGRDGAARLLLHALDQGGQEGMGRAGDRSQGARRLAL